MYFNCYPSRAFKASILLKLHTFCEVFQDTWPTCKQISRSSSFRRSAQLLHAMLVIAIRRAILSLCQTGIVCKVTEVNLELISLYIHVLHLISLNYYRHLFIHPSIKCIHEWHYQKHASLVTFSQVWLHISHVYIQRSQGGLMVGKRNYRLISYR
jgi:hypothetical protein